MYSLWGGGIITAPHIYASFLLTSLVECTEHGVQRISAVGNFLRTFQNVASAQVPFRWFYVANKIINTRF